MDAKIGTLRATDNTKIRFNTFFQILRRTMMKGYPTECGYMGLVDGEYRLFSDETDYIEFMTDEGE